MSIQRGVTYTLPFGSIATDGTANTTVVPTCVVSKDGGAQAASANAPTHNGNGEWKIVLTAAEMTAGTVSVTAYGSGLVPSYNRILTEADYTTARAVNLDNLNATVSSRSTYAGGDTAGTTTLLGRVPGTVQPQTGDAFARLGLNGAALTAVGDARLANLDATVSSRSTYAGGAVASVTAAVTVGSNQDKAGYSLATAPPTALAIRQEIDTNSIKLVNLDATMSSRLAAASYTAPTAPPTVAQIRTEMDSNSTRLANLDAAVSSRSTFAGGAVASVASPVTVGSNQDKAGYTLATEPPTAAAIRAEMDANSTRLPFLDVNISTRMAAVDFIAPPGVGAIRAEMDANSTRLANLDATISSRLAAADYTAPTTPVAAPTAAEIRTELDANSVKLANLDTNIGSRLAAVGYVAPPSAAQVAAGILITPGNKILTDALGYVTATNGGGGAAGATDWTEAERQQIRYVFNLDGARTAPTEAPIRLVDLPALTRVDIDTNSNLSINADVPISTRLAAADYTAPIAPPMPPTVVQIRTELDANSVRLANLDTNVGSRLAAIGYTPPPIPPTVVAIRQEIDANSTKLDVAVSSRLAGAAYTPPTTAPTVAQIAAGILITPANKLATDASGYVTYNNAASGGGSATDWTDAERQQIRWILGVDGIKTAPTNSTARLSDIQTVSTNVTTNGVNISSTLSVVNGHTGTLSSIQLQTNKMSFDGQSYLYVNVANYQTLKSPGEQVLMYPSLKIATDSSGNVQTAGAGGGTTAPTVVQIRTEMDANSTKLANLDTNVGSRLAGAAYTAPTTPPTVVQIRTEMDANSAKLVNLDAPVSSRLSAIGYAPPPSVAQIAAGILIAPANKLATDASGYVTYNNAASGGGSAADWTDAERQQIRFTLGLDGVKAQPTAGAGSIQGIAAQTGKIGFDGSSNVRAVTAGLTSTATVSGYSAGMGPHELVLKTPANKLATDALGDVVVPNVTLAPGGLDLITFDNLTVKSALRGIAGVAMGEITYDQGTQTGTVSSATNPNVILIRFSSDPSFTTRTNVAPTLNA